MTKYFYDQEKLQELRTECAAWLGTPYRHRSSRKGLGCDCIGFVVGVLTGIGYKKRWKMPDYPKDWHLHNVESILLQEVSSQMKHEKVSIDDPQDGDILLFRFGKTTSHAGIVLDGWIWHSVIGIGVERFVLNDPTWWHRRTYNIRLVK
jgi:NlpC/P60 family putative phage cell wall peptidase